jgi:hypothetical protein
MRAPGAALLVLLVAGCAPHAPAAPHRGAVPAASDGEAHQGEVGLGLVQRVAPFPVHDGDGRSLHHPFLGGLRSPRPQLVELTGDGRLHLFVQEQSGSVMHFLHDGEEDGLPRFRLESLRFQQLEVGEWYRFADLDGSGRLHLLTEERFSHIRFYRNEGPPEAPRFVLAADTLRDPTGRPIFSDRQNIPQFADLDCDGTADLLVGLLDGTIDRYRRVDDGEGPAPVFELVEREFEGIRIVGTFGTLHGANTMALEDVDGTGVSHLFWGDFFEPGLLLIQNSGSCEAPNFRNVPIPFPRDAPILTSGYNAPTFGDLSGDGRPDLVVGVLGGAFNPNRTAVENLFYLSREAGDGVGEDDRVGGGSWIEHTRRLLPMIDVGTESVPALVDLEGNGRLDLLVAGKLEPGEQETSRIHWFENVGEAGRPALRYRGALPIQGRFHFAPAFGDLTGDGHPDLVLGHWGPALALHRNQGDGTFALVDSTFVRITRGSNTVPTLGDLDGDGLLDLLVGKSSGWISHYRNVGTPSEPRFELVTDEFAGIRAGRRSAPHLVDLDGNGLLDLLVGNDVGEVRLYRNVGTPREPAFQEDPELRITTGGFAVPAAGDLTGDGRMEILVGGVSGGVFYFGWEN